MPRHLLAAAILASSLPLAAQTIPPSVEAAKAAVSSASIRAYDRYLSDDLLEGRYPGQRGGELAAKYIASQFESYGLKPGGDKGTFFQQVDFTSVKADPVKTTFTLVPKTGAPTKLRFADDFVVFNEQLTSSVTISAPIVWVGYGITAPEFQWDDFAGIDVKGKVILCFVNDPPSDDPNFFGGKSLTYYGRWTYKFEQAARKGAIGALIIHRTDLASYGWDVVRNSNSAEKTFIAHDENPHVKAASWIQLDVAKQIFAASGTDLDKEFTAAGTRGFKARELPIKLDATIVSTVRNFQSPNVIGILPGAPGNDQAVIYTAHYDHLGVKSDGKPAEDNIFNGAGDNGTGAAMILEMARALSVAKVTPPHSMIFAAVTAEEQGLLGSAYLAQHPPVPIGQINLDLNFDEILPYGQGDQLHASGSQRTTFYPTLETTAKRFGYSIPPPRPDTSGGYYRSDHFSFAHAGVPAFSVGQGGDLKYIGPDEAKVKALAANYNKNDYHNVTDNFHEEWDFTGNAALCRLGIELGWNSLTGPPITWKAGDEFEAARKASK